MSFPKKKMTVERNVKEHIAGHRDASEKMLSKKLLKLVQKTKMQQKKLGKKMLMRKK